MSRLNLLRGIPELIKGIPDGTWNAFDRIFDIFVKFKMHNNGHHRKAYHSSI
jgi:hypothetical protein